VTALSQDSRQVIPGSLFFALSGQHQDGRNFAAAAARAGAIAMVADRPIEGLPTIEVPDPKLALGLCAAEFFGHPDCDLKLVGVTGTNGKTTTVLLTASIAEHAGLPTGVIGTLGYRIGSRQLPAAFTTPQAPELCGLLRQMVDAHLAACAMEVSSHALAEQRVAGLQFSAAGFTQLTRDHLDYHRDPETYFQAKRRLFTERLRASAPAVVNGDDPAGRRLHQELVGSGHVTWRFGRGAECELRIENAACSLEGIRFELATPVGRLGLSSRLIGAHNVENLALAAGLGLALGLGERAVVDGLAAVDRVPGRLERVGGGAPLAFVDYAHTDDALGRVCSALRSVGAKRLVLVFGCGGERDAGKRPLMGRAAARSADLIVATSDNPRGEDPDAILAQVMPGLIEGGSQPLRRGEAAPGRSGFVVEPDRALAIRLAVACSGPQDVILVAGKGHETTQQIGARRIPFDDRVQLAAALEARAS
jgi:UDP-N-acetylmuramoyl-L-alanyl-D-glutamate--2,6-diaminopimelate ligase